MNILMMVAEDFCVDDISEAFEDEKHKVIRQKCTLDELLEPDIESTKTLVLKTEADLLFTFNYFPGIAKICNDLNIHYVSWVYDNPRVHLFSCTAIFPTNSIYVFEKDVADYFRSQGIETIHYMPLAANPSRLVKAISDNCAKKTVYSQTKDVSFVGSMYTEDHQLYSRMLDKGISQYTFGFLRGIMNAQKKIYGCDIITPSLTPDIVSDMKNALPLDPDKDSVVTTEYLFTKYVIDRQITAEERMDLLSMAGEKFDVHIYTVDPKTSISNCVNHGPAHSDIEAPAVYYSSKINLNISLRSIVNGIPLRVFEIMGSGGFLLSNYQSELLDYFVPGEDFDYFDSPEDLLRKIDYYLKHEEIRNRIAINGQNKIKAYHTFRDRVKAMKL